MALEIREMTPHTHYTKEDLELLGQRISKFKERIACHLKVRPVRGYGPISQYQYQYPVSCATTDRKRDFFQKPGKSEFRNWNNRRRSFYSSFWEFLEIEFPEAFTVIQRSLSDMPLFINDRDDTIRVIAAWRLNIGK